MENKITKLNELGILLKNGTINQEEFEKLKKEILLSSEQKKIPNQNHNNKSDNNQNTNQNKESNYNPNKQKIYLRTFNDGNGNIIKKPNIEYIDFKNISKEERRLLKEFISQKQIYASSDMTKDEVEIGNKLFTSSEIAELNSQRGGFNYAFASFLSLLTASASLYFILMSPCMIYIGAGSGGIASLVIAFTTITKPDATKLDKLVCFFSILLIIIAFIVFKSTWWGKD
jgi:hypothetical protein